MSIELNADELGEKGQSKFADICADGRLICNPSQRDRAGWDFIVELPFEPGKSQTTFDKRHAPLSCHFQIKSMGARRNTFKMRLSTLERLAKDVKPAFIYVFKFSDQLEPVETYLIHLFGNALAAILKRLRHEEAKGTKSLSDKFITLSAARRGTQIDSTGIALRKAITKNCGVDPQEYTAKKTQQLSELGFEKGRMEGKLVFQNTNADQLLDVFLGKGSVKISDFKVFENRFGIKLPFDDRAPSEGKLTIQPEPVDTCEVTLQSGLSLTATFDADAYFSPKALAKIAGVRCLIKTPLFEMIATFKDSEGSGKISTEPAKVFKEKLIVDDWLRYVRLLKIITKGDARVSIRPKSIAKTLKFSITTPPQDGVQQTEQLYELLMDVKVIMEAAGLSRRKFSIDGIWNVARSINSLCRLLKGEASEKNGEVETARLDLHDKTIEAGKTIQSTIINFIQFSDLFIAYVGRAQLTPTFESEKIHWAIEGMLVDELLELSNAKEFPEFSKEKRKQYSASRVLIERAP